MDSTHLDVFLSHSSKDAAAAELLRRNIEKWGYDCFCDHYDIKPGENWEESILEALKQSFALVVYASPAAMESKWVFAEIQIARYASKPIFFLVTDQDTQLPAHLTSIQFINAANRSGGQTFIEELQQALERHRANVPTREPTSAPPDSSKETHRPTSRPRDLVRESQQLAWRVIELLEPRRHQSEGDAERGLLLALAAVEEYAWTTEAERALLTGFLVSKLTGRLHHNQAGILDAHASGSRAVAVGEGTATVWQLPDCRLLRTFAGLITVARLSSDGTVLYAGDQLGHTKRCCIETGEVKVQAELLENPEDAIAIHKKPVAQLAVFPCGSCCSVREDGKAAFGGPQGEPGLTLDKVCQDVVPSVSTNGIIALAHDDASITLHAADGRLLRTLTGHQKAVTSVAFDAAGTTLASSAEDGSVLIWDAGRGVTLAQLKPQSPAIRQVSLSPDGLTLVTTAADNAVRIWTSEGAPICSLPTGSTHFDRAWLLANDLLVTTSADHVVRLWTTLGALRQHFVGHTSKISAVLLCANRERILTASADGNALVWSIEPGSERFCLHHKGFSVERCAFASDGTPITTTADGVLNIWNHNRQEVQRRRGHTKPIADLTVAESGIMLTVAPGEAVQLWEMGQSKPIRSFGQTGDLRTAALSPKGDRVAWSNLDGIINLILTGSPQSVRELAGHGAKVVSLVFSSDGRRLLSASEDGSACVWDCDGGVRPMELRESRYALARACFDPVDHRILTMSKESGPTRVWDAHSGKKLFALRAHDEELTDATYSPCNRWIATASRDKTIRLWDSESGKPLAVLRGHDEVPVRIRFCPEGRRLVTASSDGYALVWDAEAGALLCRLSGHTRELKDVAFSPDGQEVMTASVDGTARIYSVPRRENLIALAKSRVFRELTDDERREHGLRLLEKSTVSG